MKLFLSILVGYFALLLFTECFDGNKAVARPNAIAMTNVDSTRFYQFTLNSLEGEPVRLDQFKGKKVIILNVASKCGYTPQYADWEKFYAENKDDVVVLGFPCNQFMGQEPGSATEIAEFCQRNYGVTFPMFEKVNVKKGADQSPLFQWLTDPKQNGWNSQDPSWNFCKYVINEKGELTHFFASKVKPSSEEFLKAMGM
jgi:glutathione peroxidase